MAARNYHCGQGAEDTNHTDHLLSLDPGPRIEVTAGLVLKLISEHTDQQVLPVVISKDTIWFIFRKAQLLRLASHPPDMLCPVTCGTTPSSHSFHVSSPQAKTPTSPSFSAVENLSFALWGLATSTGTHPWQGVDLGSLRLVLIFFLSL